MKRILNISGVKKLTREQKRSIKGARRVVLCCPTGQGCEISFPEYGIRFCEPGSCIGNRCGVLY